ncbi:MAG: hypothetical protein MUP47_04300, partial [Phycisphaerae bacterium]|nr:hypothetical protein [Phycisphaerae bacterium]
GIVVADIRDGETVPALLEAAEAGRLVLAATSAPSAASAVAMLMEADPQPWVLAGNLKAVVATTTVRRLCPHCRRPIAPDDETLAQLGLMAEEVGQAFAPGGCGECFNLGYCGVAGCSSAMLMDDRLAAVFRSGPSRAELAEAIEQAGARPLLRVGLDMVREGLTSLEELARCLPR